MKGKKDTMENKNAKKPKEKHQNQADGGVNLQEREHQAPRQQEQDRLEEGTSTSDAKDALRQKTRQGLNNL